MTRRNNNFDMDASNFRALGHDLVDRIAGFYESLPTRALTAARRPAEVRELLGATDMPERGMDPSDLLNEVAPLLFDHSLHNGHPKFLGYISSSAAPLGALAEMLVAAVNPNLAKWELSPVASEIESLTVRWIADFLGFPADGDGLMVSGGNSANLHAFIAARAAASSGNMRRNGIYGEARRLTVYASADTHTWLQKAVEVCGLGASSIRWIPTDREQRIDLDALQAQVESDRLTGCQPFLVVATAGTVGTGAIDPISAMAEFCRDQDIWLHVDGAYGAAAASLPESPDDLRALALADSVAVDPHKWLYSPIEAACVLTRRPNALRDAFDFQPDYYALNDDDNAPVDFYRLGIENTRRFRALKVWLAIRGAGATGWRESIRQDIGLAEYLEGAIAASPDLEHRTRNLSVVTFRYLPGDLSGRADSIGDYLDELNKAILTEVQDCGDAFLSNAVVDGTYLLRACIVNFRTTETDLDAVLKTVTRIGQSLDSRMRPKDLAA